MIQAVDGRVPVAGHLGRTWASEAIELGIDCLEHVHASIYQDVALPEDRHPREGGNGALPNYYSWLSEGWARADLDADYVARLIDRLVERDVALSPTTVLITGGMCTLEAAAEPGQRYRPRSMTERTEQRAEMLRRMREAAEREGRPVPAIGGVDPDVGQRARAHQLEFLRRLHEAGGTVVPSTDVGAAPLQVPGFAFHRELALLVEAGISEVDVLRGATSIAARVLRREAELGTLEPGKLADVLILDGDPLRDIHDTRKVASVIRGGRVFDPADVLARIET
jgi:imidazolonepropionase-like amidohydrolase